MNQMVFRRLGVVGLGLMLSNCVAAQTLAEALDNELVWSTGGDAAWLVQSTNTHDGSDAVRTPMLGSNQVSWIETSVPGPATLRFFLLSAPANPYLWLAFTVNGNSQGQGSPGMPGQTPFWYEYAIDLPEGSNVLRWSVQNPYGSTLGFYVLDEVRVSAPRPLGFSFQAYDQTAQTSDHVILGCAAIGTPPIRFQWLKNELELVDATNSFLILPAATTNDSGLYQVVISNAQGTLVSTGAVLTVLPSAPPSFTYEPGSATLYAGETLRLNAGVSGSAPFGFEWRKNGNPIPGALTLSNYWGHTELKLVNVSEEDAVVYSLVVTNDFGSVQSSNAIVTVLPATAPVITREPRSLEVAAGTHTWLSLEATAVPDPMVAWTKLGAEPPPPSNPPPGVPAHQSAVLVITNASLEDAGVYYATVSNCAGHTLSRQVLLTVLPPLVQVGSWWQGADDIVVTNGLAFLAQGSAGLSILSVSNPAAVSSLGGVNTPGYAAAVCCSGPFVWVADGSAGLQIIAVTNPFSPFIAGVYDTTGYAADVALCGQLALVADGSAGLLVLDVSDPAHPALLGSYNTNVKPETLAISGAYAFASTPWNEALPGTNVAGTLVVDFSDPAHPVEAARLSAGYFAVEVNVPLFLGANGYGLDIFTITNPAQPVLIGSFRNPWRIRNLFTVKMSGGLAYVLGYQDGISSLAIFDLAEPADPVRIGSYTFSGSADALAINGPLVLAGGWDTPLRIIHTPFDRPRMAPVLDMLAQNGLKLRIRARPGGHYRLQYTDALSAPWTATVPFLLTNEVQLLEVPSVPAMRFFRLEQED